LITAKGEKGTDQDGGEEGKPVVAPAAHHSLVKGATAARPGCDTQQGD
jgi:hypothetical protein